MFVLFVENALNSHCHAYEDVSVCMFTRAPASINAHKELCQSSPEQLCIELGDGLLNGKHAQETQDSLQDCTGKKEAERKKGRLSNLCCYIYFLFFFNFSNLNSV